VGEITPPTGVAQSISFATADPDTVHDFGWFEEHPERRCYARAFVLGGTRWTALIHRATRLRPQTAARSTTAIASPVRLQTYAQLERLPEAEEACQAVWEKAAWPQGQRIMGTRTGAAAHARRNGDRRIGRTDLQGRQTGLRRKNVARARGWAPSIGGCRR
jgi:hypothetical protein